MNSKSFCLLFYLKPWVFWDIWRFFFLTFSACPPNFHCRFMHIAPSSGQFITNPQSALKWFWGSLRSFSDVWSDISDILAATWNKSTHIFMSKFFVLLHEFTIPKRTKFIADCTVQSAGILCFYGICILAFLIFFLFLSLFFLKRLINVFIQSTIMALKEVQFHLLRFGTVNSCITTENIHKHMCWLVHVAASNAYHELPWHTDLRVTFGLLTAE